MGCGHWSLTICSKTGLSLSIMTLEDMNTLLVRSEGHMIRLYAYI